MIKHNQVCTRKRGLVVLGLVAVLGGMWGRGQIYEYYCRPAIQRRLEHTWNENFFLTIDPHKWRISNDPIATAHSEGRNAYVYGRVSLDKESRKKYPEYNAYLEKLVKEGREEENRIQQEFEYK